MCLLIHRRMITGHLKCKTPVQSEKEVFFVSFMFKPFPYTDPHAINQIAAPESVTSRITCGVDEVCAALANEIQQRLDQNRPLIVGIEAYLSAPVHALTDKLSQACHHLGLGVTVRRTDELFIDSDVLDQKLKSFLPEDRVTDPVLLFGSLFEGGYKELMDTAAVQSFRDDLSDFRKNGTDVLIVAGYASLVPELHDVYDLRLYMDMTPKTTMLNMRQGPWTNVGRRERLPVKELLRRCYYIDFEVMGDLRGRLLRENQIDYYLASDDMETLSLVPLETMKALFEIMLTYPLRCRPVYLEGVWGGFYLKRMRNLPDEMQNCAWIFDLIPMEVSLVVDLDSKTIEFPFYTFIQTTGPQLMGEKCARHFGGYFPIRFNYDDTFHSSGNMSIQVHPPEDYIREHFNELGRQDESYYVITTGQGAQTYLGFHQDTDVEAFIEKARLADERGEAFDHDQYVKPYPSIPGRQFLIPAGTIHSSGRNQVVLEIGSLTIGSYTYKMYDYMRKDLDGTPRPIHIYHGNNVLRRERRENWVRENLIQEPRLIREGPGWKEIIVGEHPLIYFSLRNLVFDERIEDNTVDRFHVLSLVDGEQVMVRSLKNPDHFFIQNYLEILVIPAVFGPYEIINRGQGPVVIHKTLLKEGFEHDG